MNFALRDSNQFICDGMVYKQIHVVRMGLQYYQIYLHTLYITLALVCIFQQVMGPARLVLSPVLAYIVMEHIGCLP